MSMLKRILKGIACCTMGCNGECPYYDYDECQAKLLADIDSFEEVRAVDVLIGSEDYENN